MARQAASPLQMVLSVTVVCAVSAAGLALTYSVTAERIAEQNRAAQAKALAEAVPTADEFEKVDDELLAEAQEAAGEVPVYSVFSGSSGGSPTGWGVEVGPRGYGGPIRMVVGLDRDGKVVGISIVTMNETPGLGTQIVENEAFLEQFVGIESATAEDDIKGLDMITGATKSSRGARHGVEAATAVYNEVLAGAEGGGGE